MPRKPNPFMTDEDNPEWTQEMFRKARPIHEVDPDIAEGMKRLRGKRGPQKAPTKVPVSLRLNPDVVEHFKKGGKGWQARMNAVLEKNMEEHP